MPRFVTPFKNCKQKRMPLVLPFAPYYLATTYYSSKFGYLFFFNFVTSFSFHKWKCLCINWYTLLLKKRGATIYAEFLGGSFTCDAYHITEPRPDGNWFSDPLSFFFFFLRLIYFSMKLKRYLWDEHYLVAREHISRLYFQWFLIHSTLFHWRRYLISSAGAGVILAIEKALAHAGISKEDINYVNAHATSTPAGDLKEYHALSHCFGQNPEVQLLLLSTPHFLSCTFSRALWKIGS